MSIFGRRENTGSAPASSGASMDSTMSQTPSRPQQRRITHIAPGTRIQGQLGGPTELLIEGEVEGEIRVDSAVMIGNDGVVHGPVSAQVVRIGGRVFGNVSASERVEVASSGSLEGDVAAPRIAIAEGALIKGRVEMTGDKAPAPPRPEKPEKAERTDRTEEARRPKGNGEPGRSPKGSAEPERA
jgi:cytoskeletal protein CcmA (bactofilin family)